jgi:hypothetical protein
VASTLLAGAVIAGVVVMTVRTVRHAREPVYELPVLAVVTVCVAAVIAIGGAVALMNAREPGVAILSALATLLFVFGLLGLASVGALLLLASATIVVLMARRWRAHGDASAVLGGGIASLGLAVVLVVSSQPPVVDCLDHGVKTSSRSWWGAGRGGPHSGDGSSAPDGTVSGSITAGSRNYSYTCRDGQLVTFTEGSGGG